MESLNLLRYLVIRDKVTENQVRTSVSDLIVMVESNKVHLLKHCTVNKQQESPKSVAASDGLIHFSVIKLPAFI